MFVGEVGLCFKGELGLCERQEKGGYAWEGSKTKERNSKT
jgi:hypothetical protein